MPATPARPRDRGGRGAGELPGDIAALIGRPRHQATAGFPAELGYGWNTLAATENGNPLYWDTAVAEAITGGPTLPATTLSLWMRPHRWSPGATGERVALQTHFDLKERLGLPEAIMSDNAMVLGEPVRPGDLISHRQVLRSVSGPKTTRLGTGRFWVIDVEYRNQLGAVAGVESYTGFGYRRAGGARRAPADAADAADAGDAGDAGGQAPAARQAPSDVPAGRAADADAGGQTPAAKPAPGRRAKVDPAIDQVSAGDRLKPLAHRVTATTVVLGALASRDWRPMHHDHRFAVERNGARDIFLNTPNQAAWFERAITDWTGPKGRIGRMRFQMLTPVFPGDLMTVSAAVTGVASDDVGCGWVDLSLLLSVDGRACSAGAARVALPVASADNPWARRGRDWQP